MPEGQVNLTDEELVAAVREGLLDDPAILNKLDSDSRRRSLKVRADVMMRNPDAPTLRDWGSKPGMAAKQTGALLKQDATDPKLLMGLAASAILPKAMGKGMEMAPRVNPSAMLDWSPGHPFAFLKSILKEPPAGPPPTTVGATGTAMGGGPVPSGPVPNVLNVPAQSGPVPPSPMTGRTGTSFDPAPMPVPRPAAPVAPVEAPAAPAASAPAAPATAASAASPAGKLQLTAPEVLELTNLTRRGVPPPKAIEMILAARQLQASGSFANLKTPTRAQTRFPKGMRGGPPEE